MRTTVLCLFFLCFAITCWGQNCLPDGIILSSQSEVDSFRILYPDCSVIEGELLIQPQNQSSIDHLDSLYSIKIVKGDLLISRTRISDLDGLHNLEAVEGDLQISNNSFLNDLGALAGITEIGETLLINRNDSLKTINGFQNLQIANDIFIVFNDALESVIGFNQLRKLGGELSVSAPIMTQLTAFEQLDSVNGNLRIDGWNATLDGLENLVYVGESFFIRNLMLRAQNQFAKLEHIGDFMELINLESVDSLSMFNALDSVGNYILMTSSNAPFFSAFQRLPKLEKELIFENNFFDRVAGFDSLQSIGNRFSLKWNRDLIDIQGFGNLQRIEGNLYIESNELLPDLQFLSQLDEVEQNLVITENDGLRSLEGLNNLSFIGARLRISINPSLRELNALYSLRRIEGKLSIDRNDELISIDGLEHVDPSSINISETVPNSLDVIIAENTKLSDCAIKSICGVLNIPDVNVLIYLNADGCKSQDELVCSDLGLAGFVYFDTNQNGSREADEVGISNIKIQFQPSGEIIYTNENGEFYALADEGNLYTLTYVGDPDWILTSDSASYTHNFIPGEEKNLQNDFGIYPRFEAHEGLISLVSYATRCNTDVDFFLQFQNKGTFHETGTLSLQIDPKCTFLSASPAPTAIDPAANTVSWSRDSLGPFEFFESKILIQMPDETFTGEPISYSAIWESSNSALKRNTDYESVVRCSYDPNDKLAMPLGYLDENYVLISDTMTYTIRFQNTGNDVAINVAILDTLSTAFEMESFEVLNSSHPVEVRREGHIVEFVFNDIYLPDSLSNEPASHGFVTYQIQPKADTEDYTIAENTAHIFFDFNPAIVTNTTSHTLVERFPIVSTKEQQLPNFEAFPNPTTGLLELRGLEAYPDWQIEVYNALGHRLLRQSASQVDLSTYAPGVYWMKVQIGEQFAVLDVLLIK
ncbi:MAG: T9SS type A sorting domain-containing protein [Bacteroidota bacterium]